MTGARSSGGRGDKRARRCARSCVWNTMTAVFSRGRGNFTPAATPRELVVCRCQNLASSHCHASRGGGGTTNYCGQHEPELHDFGFQAVGSNYQQRGISVRIVAFEIPLVAVALPYCQIHRRFSR